MPSLSIDDRWSLVSPAHEPRVRASPSLPCQLRSAPAFMKPAVANACHPIACHGSSEVSKHWANDWVDKGPLRTGCSALAVFVAPRALAARYTLPAFTSCLQV